MVADAVRESNAENAYERSEGEDAPRTSFTNTDSRACKVVSKALVMLKQATQLELGHGLFVGTRAHNVLGLL